MTSEQSKAHLRMLQTLQVTTRTLEKYTPDQSWRGNPIDDERIQEMKRLEATGKTRRAIAGLLGVAVSSVSKHLGKK